MYICKIKVYSYYIEASNGNKQMISNYPNLQSVLIDTIPKHVYGDLQKFNIPSLPFADRKELMSAYRDDVAQDVFQDLIHEKLCPGEVATMFKDGAVSVDLLIENIAQEEIYDLAQEMGPILKEIERNSHIADRSDER